MSAFRELKVKIMKQIYNKKQQIKKIKRTTNNPKFFHTIF